ncbi:MAG: bifunctional hydroxymethylpyrimidine kinase/phosphomethylpyrimidine kinase [Gammaproteobacteria bacterium]|nr:bifunctional hydroxymethylpyrimidine kinase/phosphomethylpyrimidine kinase [Gammaproteobacteria bacterium]
MNTNQHTPLFYPRALTIATSDSGGGAGVQADLKTFSALGCYGMSVFAALTAQNTLGVQGILDIPPDFIKMQLDSVLSDIGVDAIKVGVLRTQAAIDVVADSLTDTVPVVLDPVMIAKSGDSLLKRDAIEAMVAHLFPRATLVTPNLPEAAAFLGYKIEHESQMLRAANDFCSLGVKAVLLKGGHLEADHITDLLYLSETQETHWFPKTKIQTRNTHGTGCTLSSAVTAYLARGKNLVEAVTLANDYLRGALLAGKDYVLGTGHGPVHHFWLRVTD